MDVIALGELLIDFVSTQTGLLRQAPAFVKAPGGAPANVLVGVARLGRQAGFIGQVGDDEFGRFLAGVLQENRVDISHLRLSNEGRTPLAFVSLQEDGERDFLFYWEHTADKLLAPEDIDPAYIGRARIFHFGTISLIDSPAREATWRAAALARTQGLIVSCDPNLRLSLWPSVEAACDAAWQAMRRADLIKVSGEELQLLTGKRDLSAGAQKLRAETGAPALVVTLGPQGCYYDWGAVQGSLPGFAVQAVDTTGAGDAFLAALLVWLVDHTPRGIDLAGLPQAAVETALQRANACGALTCTQRGAIPALPTREELEAFLQR